MLFLNSIDYLTIDIDRGVRTFLARQGKDDSRMLAARLQSGPGISHFEFGPLAPEINSGSGFEHVSNVGAAHARRNFQKIVIAVRVALDKFSMGRTGLHAHGLNQTTIDLQKLFLVRGVMRDCLRDISAAAMRDLQWRPPVTVHAGEDHAAV